MRGARGWLEDIAEASDSKSRRTRTIIGAYLKEASNNQSFLNAAIRACAINDDPQIWYRSVEEYKNRYLIELLRRE
jgi:hypothetical protein